MRTVIYETTGRAKEFAELAINFYDFCSHGCVYCYSPLVIHKNRGAFTQGLYSRITVQDILKSAKEWADKGETRRILLCFTCDPYQEIEQETMITRKTIMALHEVGLNVVILTKGGLRSTRDFDLLTSKDAYATTLTCLNMKDSTYWEPKAALPEERIRALAMSHKKGIETWVSFEPVIYPQQVKALLGITNSFVGHYKIGKLNYPNRLPPEYQKIVQGIDWRKFGWDMKSLLDKLGVKSYFKKDLLKEMGVAPENFEQTWVCK